MSGADRASAVAVSVAHKCVAAGVNDDIRILLAIGLFDGAVIFG